MLDGSKGHAKSKGLCISYGKEMIIINLEQDFLYTTEYFSSYKGRVS
jgi:hypothetical protein